jgi:uncharacterized protein YsxB (DUF464 family)
VNQVQAKVGIVELKKVIDAAGNGFIGLKDVNWGELGKEITDLDSTERKEILVALSEMLLKLVGFAQEYKSIIRLLIKLLA